MPLFNKSLDLQISSLAGSFKKINAFLVHLTCSNETFHVKWCPHKSVFVQSFNKSKHIVCTLGQNILISRVSTVEADRPVSK